jgi:hypothetical protein
VTTSNSFFQPASKSERWLKVLLTGSYGTGKTRAALSFPGPIAVIDLEGGTALYEGSFDVLRTKDLRRIEQAIDSLANSAYKTVVIDPITVIYSLLQDAAQSLVERRNNNQSTMDTGKALTPREWGLIKREYNALVTKLINLPMHVVLVAREKDLYEGTGDNMRKIGVQADTEKGTPYLADFVLHMMTEAAPGGKGDTFYCTVEKSRSAMLPKGQRLTGYGADSGQGLFPRWLADVAGAHASGQRVQMDDDTTVAAGNADVLERQEQRTTQPTNTRRQESQQPAQQATELVSPQRLSAIRSTAEQLGLDNRQLKQFVAGLEGYPSSSPEMTAAQGKHLLELLEARLADQQVEKQQADEV